MNSFFLHRKKIIFLTAGSIVLIFIMTAFLMRGTLNNATREAQDAGIEVKQGNAVLTWVKEKTRKKISPSEYVAWIRDPANGLMKSRNITWYKFEAQYKPSEYMVLSESKDLSMKQSVLEEKRKEYNPYMFFTFAIRDTISQDEILKSGIRSEQEYMSRLDYFSFRMQKDLFLVAGKDTLPCIMYNYERVFGLAPEAKFTIGFNRPKERNEDISLIYQDNTFGVGIVKLKFNREQLADIPFLDMNKK